MQLVHRNRFVSKTYVLSTKYEICLQSTSSRRILLSITWLSLLTFALTVSTYIHTPAGIFFTFVLTNGIAQAAAGSYLQTAVIAVASLFGPTAIQAVMTGQAVIAIAVSGVEVLSAAGSISTSATGELVAASEPEEKSAFVFFALSTAFLIFSAGAQVVLTRLPIYKTLMQQFHETAERAMTASQELTRHVESKRHQLVRVGKANIIYNCAVAYVFVVTLVSTHFNQSCYCLTINLSVGCIPSYHDFNPPYQSGDTPPPLQCNPLLYLQRRRLPWPLHLLFPSASDLVCKASSHPLSRPHTLHSSIPNV
jgi:hypothetical protein